MNIETIFPVLTLLAGWLLNELSLLFRLRRDDRRVISRAIADLLEIRHELKGFNLMIAELKKRFSISSSDEFNAKKIIDDFFFQTDDLQKRYNEAVTLIASQDPILGFRLRSKDQFKPLLRKVRVFLENDSSAKDFFLQFETKLYDQFLQHLEELIIDLSKKHRWRTWLKMRRRFSKAEDMPEVVNDLLSSIQPYTQKAKL